MSEFKKIIVHDGNAHQDDVLAVALALASYGMMPVERKNPSEAELQDPHVLVLDVGNRHEPELSNFDHHQNTATGPDDARPAFQLLAAHLGIEDDLKENDWYQAAGWLDCLGPTKTAELLGLGSLPKELLSPIEIALVDLFAKGPDELICNVLELIGEHIIHGSRQKKQLRKQIAEKMERVEVGGLQGVILSSPVLAESWQIACLEKEVDRMGLDGQVVAFTMVVDARGQGWALYREKDHPGLDFSRLGDDDRIAFAHKGGFVAKTKTLLPKEQVLSMVKKALV